MYSWLKGLAIALLAVAVVMPVAAEGDPPGRVGRLAWTENQVFFRVDRSDTAAPASINWPVSQGALFNTDRDGLAELWIGSTALRLAGISELEVLALDDDKIDLRLNEGTLAVTVLDPEQANDLRIGTPEGAVRFAAAGRYRIDILSGRSEVTTYAGQALIEDGERLISLRPGQRAVLDGGGYLRAERAYRADRFDDWVARREALAVGGESRRHVSPEIPGIHDLDRHGDWQQDAEYGTVWLPRTVATDWAPYRQGRWAWIAPWGWTWIDAAPWGFAPFHYGRWVMLGPRWAWVPGQLRGRPVYAPALVGWVGEPGWQVSFSFGSAPAVGWFPLAPREVYVPAYRHSHRHLQQINITTVHNVTVIDRSLKVAPAYRYRDRSQALTIVPVRQFSDGRPVVERHHGQFAPKTLPAALERSQSDWLRPGRDARRPHGESELASPKSGRPLTSGPASTPVDAGRLPAEPPRVGAPVQPRPEMPDRARSRYEISRQDPPRHDMRPDQPWPARRDASREPRELRRDSGPRPPQPVVALPSSGGPAASQIPAPSAVNPENAPKPVARPISPAPLETTQPPAPVNAPRADRPSPDWPMQRSDEQRERRQASRPEGPPAVPVAGGNMQPPAAVPARPMTPLAPTEVIAPARSGAEMDREVRRAERRERREAWRDAASARPTQEPRDLPGIRPAISAPPSQPPAPAVNPENRAKPVVERPFAVPAPAPAAPTVSAPPIQMPQMQAPRPMPAAAPLQISRPEPAPVMAAPDAGRRHERREERAEARAEGRAAGGREDRGPR